MERSFAFFASLARTAMRAAREGRMLEVGRTNVGDTVVIRYAPGGCGSCDRTDARPMNGADMRAVSIVDC